MNDYQTIFSSYPHALHRYHPANRVDFTQCVTCLGHWSPRFPRYCPLRKERASSRSVNAKSSPGVRMDQMSFRLHGTHPILSDRVSNSSSIPFTLLYRESEKRNWGFMGVTDPKDSTLQSTGRFSQSIKASFHFGLLVTNLNIMPSLGAVVTDS